MCRLICVVALWCFSLCSIVSAQQARNGQTHSDAVAAPVEIAKMFIPSGFMGDGEMGKKYVQVKPVVGEKPRRAGDVDGMCIKVSYQPGAVGWAGVYWQYPANNWGDQPGRSVRSSTKVVFWAAGQKGGEIVEFKSGGISAGGKKYRDSYEVTLGSLALTKDWKKYEMNLKGKDLSNVIGAFAWVATADANPGGLTFYLDDLRFE